APARDLRPARREPGVLGLETRRPDEESEVRRELREELLLVLTEAGRARESAGDDAFDRALVDQRDRQELAEPRRLEEALEDRRRARVDGVDQAAGDDVRGPRKGL